MKIYLIRHGETTGDIENRYGGDYEDNLTEKGTDQGKELANNLKDENIEIIYHSPRIRATETAKILSEELEVSMQVVENIRERNGYGVLTGLTKEEAKEKYPEDVAKLEADSIYHNDVLDVENYESFKDRVIKSFKEIINNETRDVIAVVAHGGPIRCLVREFLGLGEMKGLGDCGYLEINKEGDEFKVMKLSNAEIN